jgi:thioredoxin 1
MSAAHITATNFDREVLQSDQPVLVDFYSNNCPPCRALAPYLDEMAKEFAGCAKIVKVNVDVDPGLAVKYGVSAVPTLIWFDAGQPVERTVGAHPASLRQRLRALCIA